MRYDNWLHLTASEQVEFWCKKNFRKHFYSYDQIKKRENIASQHSDHTLVEKKAQKFS